jgi:predicted DNA-binding transcriptional regulator AlpA
MTVPSNCNRSPLWRAIAVTRTADVREQCLSTVADQIPQTAAGQKALRLKSSKSKPTLTPELSAENRQHQVEAALADNLGDAQDNHRRVPPARGPPSLVLRLLAKPEVLLIADGISYPTLWSWMRAGTFPRSRIVGGKSMWRSDEVQAWLDALPLRPLKGDAGPDEKRG